MKTSLFLAGYLLHIGLFCNAMITSTLNMFPLTVRINKRTYKFNVTSAMHMQQQIEKITKITPSEQEFFVDNLPLNVSDTRFLQHLDSKDVIDVKRRPQQMPAYNAFFRQAMRRMPPAQMKQAMNEVAKLLENEKLIDDFFSDEKKLEMARIHVKNNIKLYETVMPGFKAQAAEVVNDTSKWKDAMLQVREKLYELKRLRKSDLNSTISIR